MSEIILKCINHVISVVNTPDISSGNVNYDTVLFELCPNWTGFTKTAVFYRTEDETYYQLLDSNNRCTIPKEVLREKGKIYIGLFGVNGNKTITSDVITYNVSQGAITTGLKPSDPTPDIYAQLIGQYSNLGAEIDVERKRIDSIVSGATADANAELRDIRIGADGMVYGSAGDAVRSQFRKIKEVNALAIVNEASGKEIIVTDSADYGFKNLKVYGDSTQALPVDILFTPSSFFGPYEENGITYTPVANNGIKISGTNTGDSSVSYSLYYSKTDLLCATDFVFDTGASDGAIDYMYYEYLNGGGSNMRLNTSAKSSTIRPNVGIVGQEIRLYVPKGKTIDVTIYPTVKKVFGPSAPLDVKGVKGKNELDCSGLTAQTSNGITFTPVYENGLLKYINVNGTNTTSEVAKYTLKQTALTNNNQYILNGCPSGGSGTTFKLDCFYSGSSAFDDIGKGVTFTARKGETITFRIIVFGGATVNNEKFYPMLRDASIEDGTYSPYNSFRFKSRGKNVFGFEKSAIDVTKQLRALADQRLTFTKIDDNSIKCNYTGGTYGTGYVEINGIDGTKDYAISFVNKENSLGYTPRIEKSASHCTENKLVLSIYSGCGNNEISSDKYFILSDIQVESGTTVTPFEPFNGIETADLSGIELHGIGDVKDYIDLERGVIVRKFRGKHILKSDMFKFTQATNGNYIATNVLDGAKALGKCICTHFLGIDTADRIKLAHLYRCYSETDKRVYFRDTADGTLFSNATDTLAVFENNDVYLLYELETPIEEPLSDANLQALRELHSYKPTTVLTNDVGADMDLAYVADTKLYIDKRISEIATAILNN